MKPERTPLPNACVGGPQGPQPAKEEIEGLLASEVPPLLVPGLLPPHARVLQPQLGLSCTRRRLVEHRVARGTAREEEHSLFSIGENRGHAKTVLDLLLDLSDALSEA